MHFFKNNFPTKSEKYELFDSSNNFNRKVCRKTGKLWKVLKYIRTTSDCLPVFHIVGYHLTAVCSHHSNPVGHVIAIVEGSLRSRNEGVVTIRGHCHTSKQIPSKKKMSSIFLFVILQIRLTLCYN